MNEKEADMNTEIHEQDQKLAELKAKMPEITEEDISYQETPEKSKELKPMRPGQGGIA